MIHPGPFLTSSNSRPKNYTTMTIPPNTLAIEPARFHSDAADEQLLERCRSLFAEAEALAEKHGLTVNHWFLLTGAGQALADESEDDPTAIYTRTIVRLHDATGWAAGAHMINGWSGDYDDDGIRYFPRCFAPTGPTLVSEDAINQNPTDFATLYDLEGHDDGPDSDDLHRLRECADGKFRILHYERGDYAPTKTKESDLIVTHVGLDVACWFFGVDGNALRDLADDENLVSLSAARTRLSKLAVAQAASEAAPLTQVAA